MTYNDIQKLKLEQFDGVNALATTSSCIFWRAPFAGPYVLKFDLIVRLEK